MAAGNRQLTFDGSNLSSGTYLYRLESEGRRLVHRMMLIK